MLRIYQQRKKNASSSTYTVKTAYTWFIYKIIISCYFSIFSSCFCEKLVSIKTENLQIKEKEWCANFLLYIFFATLAKNSIMKIPLQFLLYSILTFQIVCEVAKIVSIGYIFYWKELIQRSRTKEPSHRKDREIKKNHEKKFSILDLEAYYLCVCLSDK